MIATYTLVENALQSDNLKSSAKNVFIYLVQRANKKLECFPAIKTIANILKISISTVKRAIRELVQQGFIKRIERFRADCGGQTSNLYILMKEPKPIPQEPNQAEPMSLEYALKENEEAQDGTCTSSIADIMDNVNNIMVSQEDIVCQEISRKPLSFSNVISSLLKSKRRSNILSFLRSITRK